MMKHLKNVFSSDYASIEWDKIDIVFVCVQTPNNIETNSVDTKFLESAIKEINNVNNNDLVITVKSTIPPYEIEKVCEKVGMDSSKLTFNPEFLREVQLLKISLSQIGLFLVGLTLKN